MPRRRAVTLSSVLFLVILPLTFGLCCQPAAPDEKPGDDEPGQPVPTVLEAVATASPNPANGGQIVILDASGSVGSAGATLTFAWAQTGGTPTVTLVNPGAAQSGFIAPTLSEDAVLSFTVTVTDGADVDTASVDVTVVRTNRAPVADAGLDQTVGMGLLVGLDGTGSSDPDGDAITYAWTQIAGPPVELEGADTVDPNFWATGAREGDTLTFQLTVSDGELTATDTVDVVVGPRAAGGGTVVKPNMLGLIPDDINWLLALRSIQGLFGAVDGVVDDPGRVESLVRQFMEDMGLGDVNLPDLNGAFAAFQLKPEVVPTVLQAGNDYGSPPPCLLFQLSISEIEGFILEVIQARSRGRIEVQETALEDPFTGVTRIDFTEMPIIESDGAQPSGSVEEPFGVLTLFVAPLGGGQYTLLTGGPGYVPEDFQTPFARAIKRVVDWQGLYIEQRFDAKWVSSFKAGHVLAWAEGDVVFQALAFILGGIFDVVPFDGATTSAGESMAKLMGSLPMAVAMPTELVDGNPFSLDDVCLIIKVAEPGVGSLWVRFDEDSGPAQYLNALPNTSDSMLLGLPDEPVFGAFGMVGPWVDYVLDEMVSGNVPLGEAAAIAGAKPLVRLVQDASDGRTLMMGGSISELRPLAGPAPQEVPVCGPRVGAALVVSGPGVGDPGSGEDLINRILNQIDDEEPDWIDYETQTGETVGNADVVWLWINSYELTDGEGVPHPVDVIWDFLPECRFAAADPAFGWDILVRVARAGANHVVFSIDSLGPDHAMARLEGMVADVLAGKAPLADRPVIKNAAATLATSRTAVAYLAAWPDPKAPVCPFNTGQFLKFEYDLAMFHGQDPPVEADPGDAMKAMALSFGSYGGRIAELYVSIPIEDLLKAALRPIKD